MAVFFDSRPSTRPHDRHHLGTYSILANSQYPRGKVTAVNNPSYLQIDWLKSDGTFQSVNTPNADVAALGGLTQSTMHALGLLA